MQFLVELRDILVVGAEDERSSATGINGDETDDSAAGNGAAYLFMRDSNGAWSQIAYIKASVPYPTTLGFGSALAVNEYGIAISANDGFNPGAVYIFD